MILHGRESHLLPAFRTLDFPVFALGLVIFNLPSLVPFPTSLVVALEDKVSVVYDVLDHLDADPFLRIPTPPDGATLDPVLAPCTDRVPVDAEDAFPVPGNLQADGTLKMLQEPVPGSSRL